MNLRKFLFLFYFVLFCAATGWAEDWSVSLPRAVVTVNETATNNVVAATSASDNSHWYVLQQKRGSLTPAYDNGLGNNIMRASGGVNTIITNGQTLVNGVAQYLVRFIPGDYDGTYKIQFATGRYFGGTGQGTTSIPTCEYSDAKNYLVYNINNENQHIGINFTTDGTTYGGIVDNNGAGYNLSFWSTGQVTTTNGNNDWQINEVTLEEVTTVDVTYILQLNGTNLGQTTVEEKIGKAPTFSIPTDIVEYVDGSETLPDVITADKTSYTINTKYKDNFIFATDGSKEYSLKCRSNLFIYASSSEASTVSLTNEQPAYTTNDYRWTITGDWYNGFQITNKATDKHIAGPNASPAGGADASLTSDDANSYYDIKVDGSNWVFKQHGTQNSYLSNWGGYPACTNLKYYGVIDDGTRFVATALKDLDTEITEAFDALGFNETDKFDLTSSTIVYPQEFDQNNVKPAGINSAIDNYLAVSTTEEKKTFMESANGQILARYRSLLTSMSSNYDISSVKLTMKAEWGTLIVPFSVANPGDLDVYTCSGVEENGTTLTLTSVTGTIVHNRPFIIHGTVGNTYTFIGWDRRSKANHTEGVLTGVLGDDKYVPKDSYILAKRGDKIGFYQVADDNIKAATKNKCYLTLPESTSASAPAFFFPSDDDLTGIDSNITTTEDGAIYNLQGLKVTETVKGQIYIKNHKLFKAN